MRALESLKILLWSGTYVQSIEIISQKVTEELCVISLNSDAKFREDPKWYEEFGEFWYKHSKVLKLELWWVPFVQSKLMYELKNFREVMCNETEEWCKTWSGIDFSFEK